MPIEEKEVINMRKITLGIFSILTIILFYFSTLPTVTATTHEFHPVDLYSTVGIASPWAFVEIDIVIPEQQWSIDISNGDTVKVITDYYWTHGPITVFYPWETCTGYHEFWFKLYYPEEELIDSKYILKTTTKTADSGSDSWDITTPVATENSYIFVEWKVKCTHVESRNYDELEEEGYIYLY
jgi:hypothetical protein